MDYALCAAQARTIDGICTVFPFFVEKAGEICYNKAIHAEYLQCYAAIVHKEEVE